RMIAELLCIWDNLFNMTVQGAIDIDKVFSNYDGLTYWQFQNVFIHLNNFIVLASNAIGVVFHNDDFGAVALTAGLSVSNLLQSAGELIPGIFYECIYGTHNPFVFIDSYWLNGFNGGTLRFLRVQLEAFGLAVEVFVAQSIYL